MEIADAKSFASQRKDVPEIVGKCTPPLPPAPGRCAPQPCGAPPPGRCGTPPCREMEIKGVKKVGKILFSKK